MGQFLVVCLNFLPSVRRFAEEMLSFPWIAGSSIAEEPIPYLYTTTAINGAISDVFQGSPTDSITNRYLSAYGSINNRKTDGSSSNCSGCSINENGNNNSSDKIAAG